MELFAGYEREGFNIDNVWHKFTLQYMFMSRILYELNEFKESWNNHPMKTGHNYTRLQLILLRNYAIDYDAPFNWENYGEDDVDDDNINPQNWKIDKTGKEVLVNPDFTRLNVR